MTKKADRENSRPAPVPAPPPSFPWLGVAIASAWGALAVSLSITVWFPLGGAVGDMWRAWISAPDFSWPALFRACGGHLAGLGTLAAIAVGAYGAGWPVARFLGIGHSATGVFLQSAAGWGLVSLVQQGLGLPGLYFHGLFGAESLLFAGLGAAALAVEKPWRHFAGADWKSEWPRLLILAGLMVAAYLLSRMPDTDEDARLYHLAGPENYLFLHRINAVPGHFAWHMPFGAEMDFLVPFALGGFSCAKQVNVAMLAVLLGLAWRLSVALGRGSLWASVWTGTAGLVLSQCWEGKNDIALAMYCAGSALCVAEAVKGKRSWLVPAAWLAGLAIGVKFTAGLFVAGICTGLFLFISPRPAAARILSLGVLGLLPFVGWLAESWLFLGNPFHPFLSGLFPDLGWGPFYSGWLNRQARVISPAEALMRRDWLLGMWRGIGAWNHGSAALFGLLPLALLGRKSREARVLAVCAAVAYLLWLPSHRNARYLFPLIPLISALASDGGGAVGVFSGWGRRWRNAMGGYVSVLALVMAVWCLTPSGYLFLLGQSSRMDVLSSRFTTWEEMRRWVNSAVPPGGRVLLSGEERRLWFDRRIVSNGPVFEPPFWKLTRESFTPAEVRKRVRQAGLSHMVNNFVTGQYRRLRWFPGPDWDDRQIRLYRDFASRYFVYVWRSRRVDNANGGFQAILFAPSPLRRPGSVYFLPGAEGVFWAARRAYESGLQEDAMAESARALARMAGVRDAEYLRGVIVTGIPGSDGEVWRILEPGIREGFITSHNIGYGARAAFNAGRLDDARRLFVVEALMSPWVGGEEGLAQTLLMRSRAGMARQDFRSAWRDAEAAGGLLPWDARFKWAAANALMALGRYAEASRFLAEGKRLAGVGDIPASGGIGPGAPPRSMMGK